MSGLDLVLSLGLTFVLHASLLLGAAWLVERFGWLRHSGVAELAWRIALFGALVSTGLQFAPRLDLATLSPDTTAASRTNAAHRPLALHPAQLPTPRASAATSDTAALGDAVMPPPAPSATNLPRTETADAPGTVVPLPSALAAALLALWALVTGLAALRLGRQLLALRRLRRQSLPLPAASTLHRHATELARGFGLSPPPLRGHAAIASPMVLPGGTVLLPAWAAAMPEAQQRALLAHEIAHLHRRDPAWRLLQRMVLLLLAFHPLARHAVRRLEALAEDACDAHAAQRLGSGRPLAECLAACLSHAGARAALPTLAVAMAGESGPVVRRVKNLLEETPMRPRSLSPVLRRSTLTLALAAAIALPGLAVSTYAPPAQAATNWLEKIFGDDDSYTYRASEDGVSLLVHQRGKIGFNAAETDVVSLAAGARLQIKETRDGVTRGILFHGVDGRIVRDYRVDGEEATLDAAGRAWLAQMLPRVLRESGVDAEARGKRILAQGGADALLAEISLIRSDYAARRYLQVLFGETALDEAQLKRALALAAGIGSDFEMRQALTTAFDAQKLTPAHQAQVLDAAQDIGSDFELAELLGHFAQTQPVQGEALPAWQRALETIGSDFEHRRVLEALIERGGDTPGAVRVALESASGIGSDFELRQVLEKAAAGTRKDPAALAAWFAAAQSVGSDFEHREALVALVEAGPVDLGLANGVLDSLGTIGSDFEAGEALEALARRMPNDPALIERYRAAARQLGDFERGQAEKALDRFVATR